MITAGGWSLSGAVLETAGYGWDYQTATGMSDRLCYYDTHYTQTKKSEISNGVQFASALW